MQQPKGSGFTNINRILQANQQNRLGQAISSGINKGAQQFKTGLQQSQNTFGSSIDEIAKKRNQDVANVADATSKLTSGQTTVGSDTLDSANRLINQNYGQEKLSSGLENINNLASQARQTESSARQTGTAEGRQNLLQRYVGKGQYTGGQQRLDNLILGQTGAQDLASARRSGVGLGADLVQAQQGATGQAQALQQGLQNARREAIMGVNTGLNTIAGQVQGIAETETAARQAELAKVNAIIEKLNQAQRLNDPYSLFSNTGESYVPGGKLTEPSKIAQDTKTRGAFTLTPEEIKMLGLDFDNNSYFTGDLNLQNIINSLSPTANATVTSTQAMTPDQKAAYLALQRLGGTETINPLTLTEGTQVGDKGVFDVVNEDQINKEMTASNRSVEKDFEEFNRLLTDNAELNALSGTSLDAYRQGGLKGLYDAELQRLGLQGGATEADSLKTLAENIERGGGAFYGDSFIGGDYGKKTLPQAFADIDKLVDDPLTRDRLKANIAINALIHRTGVRTLDPNKDARDFWRTGNWIGRAKDLAKGGERFKRVGNLMRRT